MRIAKFAALAAAVMMGLAACGGDTGESSTKTLTVWRFGEPTADDTEIMSQVGAEFEQAKGVSVEVEWIPWPKVTEKLTAAAAGGDGPDVTEIGNTQVVTWAAQDTLLDITDQVRAWTEGQTIPKHQWANETIGGKTYAVPWLGATRGVYYRKDWFAELGIQTPKNWADLLAAAQKIKSAKAVDGFAVSATSADALHGFAPFVWGNGGQIVADEGGKWVSKLNTPQAKEALAFVTDLVKKEQVSSEGVLTKDSVEIGKMFANGSVGMFAEGPFGKGNLLATNKITDAQLGVFPLPGKTGGIAGQFAGGNDLAIWKDTGAPQLSFEYLQLLAGKKYTDAYGIKAGLLPFYPDLLAGDAYAKDPWLSNFIPAMSQARTYAVHEKWIKVEESVVQRAIKDVVTGKASVDAAADAAAKAMDETLNS
ncbi:extracellular solute-binding protein [Nocardia sp. XZ_19_385]|uniref:extracellular solute-binding protein n=1 Tax=Nocardia sp. XZ_19_385 TaxID=2769488 RepID=UPI00188EAD27|nr:extracellular solute-binding protein [Nocardia sp. XZ_19_385]